MSKVIDKTAWRRPANYGTLTYSSCTAYEAVGFLVAKFSPCSRTTENVKQSGTIEGVKHALNTLTLANSSDRSAPLRTISVACLEGNKEASFQDWKKWSATDREMEKTRGGAKGRRPNWRHKSKAESDLPSTALSTSLRNSCGLRSKAPNTASLSLPSMDLLRTLVSIAQPEGSELASTIAVRFVEPVVWFDAWWVMMPLHFEFQIRLSDQITTVEFLIWIPYKP